MSGLKTYLDISSPGKKEKSANSPLLKSLVEMLLIKVLNPSSIQAYLRSLLPTTIGNHVCPNSWSVTPHKPEPVSEKPQNTMPGYSIPPTIPATLVATGYGNSNHRLE